MQELYNLVVARFKRIQQIVNGGIQNQIFRTLKQQEKIRSQKEGFLLNLMKALKNLSNDQKINYFQKSLDIMKIIHKQFEFKKISNQQISQNFLDSFVTLYQIFFQHFQQSMQFKTHVKNFLRPTNHNVINDLIKYLIDFSRDYYQQTFIWYNKQKWKEQQNKNVKIQSQQKYKKLRPVYFQAPRAESQLKNSRIAVNLRRKKQNYELSFKNYQILNILIPNIVNGHHFQKYGNSQLIKMKINEVFRDLKFRNNLLKSTYQKYRLDYNQKFNIKNDEEYRTQQQKFEFPYSLCLTIQKNGFSCINIIQKKVIKTIKVFEKTKKSQKQLHKLQKNEQMHTQIVEQTTPINRIVKFLNQNTQTLIIKNKKSDYLLNSLKVLKPTQNFLPPLILNHTNEKIKKDVEQLLLHQSTNEQKQDDRSSVKTEKQLFRYFNGQMQKQEIKTKLQKKRLKSIKKKFSEGQKGQNSNEVNIEQDKFGEWLDKLKNLDEIQKKKIMGLN